MATPEVGAGRPGWAARRRLSAVLWRRPWLRAAGLLVPPLGWLVAVYLLALIALFVSAFWGVDVFTSKLVHSWTAENFRTLWDSPSYRNIALRTVGIAAAVTVTDAAVAFPFAYYTARIARPRTRTALFVAVLVPLWVSYLVRVYAWRLILAEDGALNWTLAKLGLPTIPVAYSLWAMWIVFSYIWLPFMVLPIYSALERIPDSLLEASADLGGRSFRTFRTVVFPLALPGVAAGSIFTFSLTLGDYIAPTLVGGGPGSQLIGNVVYDNFQKNLPLATAYSVVPLVIVAVYLLLARRTGAFESL